MTDVENPPITTEEDEIRELNAKEEEDGVKASEAKPTNDEENIAEGGGAGAVEVKSGEVDPELEGGPSADQQDAATTAPGMTPVAEGGTSQEVTGANEPSVEVSGGVGVDQPAPVPAPPVRHFNQEVVVVTFPRRPMYKENCLCFLVCGSFISLIIWILTEIDHIAAWITVAMIVVGCKMYEIYMRRATHKRR